MSASLTGGLVGFWHQQPFEIKVQTYLPASSRRLLEFSYKLLGRGFRRGSTNDSTVFGQAAHPSKRRFLHSSMKHR